MPVSNIGAVGERSCKATPYDLASEVARLGDLEHAASIVGEILGDVGVKRPEIQRAGGLLLAGLLLAHLPEFKLPPKREVV